MRLTLTTRDIPARFRRHSQEPRYKGMGETLHHKRWRNRKNSPPRGPGRGDGATEVGYGDIGHPAGSNTVLLIHSGGILTQPSDNYSTHCKWRLCDPDYPGSVDCAGRVDTAEKIGSLAIEPDLDLRQARRIVEDALVAFPGIKFRVFTDRVAGGVVDRYGSMSVQEFWEATE